MVGMFGIRLIGVVVAVAVMIVGFEPGLASAYDPITGRKYSEAAAWISKRGTPVVATVSGSQLALDDCIVISWNKGGYLNSRGKRNREREYYLHLNCNNAVATPGHPGNSVMTPEGAKRKAQIERAERLNANPEQCQRSETSRENCRRFCNNSGLCKFKV